MPTTTAAEKGSAPGGTRAWESGRCARGHDITDPEMVSISGPNRRCRACLRLGRSGLLPSGPLLAAAPLVGQSAARIAELCGVTQRTVTRWRSGTPLKAAVADVAAVRLGMHPLEIWGWVWVDSATVEPVR
jgi:hypothetical protein